MAVRHLYLARHGDADPFGRLTDSGQRQAALLGERLAGLPLDTVWHSPLPRAAASARELARHLPPDAAVTVAEAAELIDHIPYVPTPAETPPAWIPDSPPLTHEWTPSPRSVRRSVQRAGSQAPDVRNGHSADQVLYLMPRTNGIGHLYRVHTKML